MSDDPDLREPSIQAVAEAELEEVLPLIAAYQRFYEATDIDEQRNRKFFSRFIAPSDEGLLISATIGGEVAGFACMYWFFSSTQAVETVLMNDLFVAEGRRGSGVGRALIDACVGVARERGAHHLEWATAPDNTTAQRLYDSTGAERSTWLTYEIRV